MAEKKDTVKEIAKVKDYSEVVKGITGLVRENYQNSFEFALTLWEENLKVLNTQVDQWLSIHQDYTNSVKEIYEKFPKDAAALWDGKGINNEFNRILAFQKEYIGFFRNASEKFTKETLNLTKKNVDKALSIFDEFLNLVRV